MRVLVACEFSGVVREAFIARGHDAYSCDLRQTDRQTDRHIVGDALEVISIGGWDLLIAHPPCTYLSYAATSSWNQPGRAEKRDDAMQFFMALMDASVSRVCVENPVGWPNTVYRKPDQIIEPFYFGDSARKRTCLWLRNLPRLWWRASPTLFDPQTAVDAPEPVYIDKSGKRRHFTDALHGGQEKERSVTFPGIANAMAEQWGAL